MKKTLLILLTALSFTVYGQQFSFQMFFTDAIGNKDTITIGYDPTATDSIDASFGEVNIISVPIDTSSLDVRITDEWHRRTFDELTGTFHTKKQIAFYDCTSSPFSVLAIDIYTKHWPVTATWDSTLFKDKCRNGSVFTSVTPGGWWDVSSQSDLWRRAFISKSSVTFTSNTSGNGISTFWQAFSDSTLLHIGINELTANKNSIDIFPNPTSHFISVATDKSFGTINRIEFYNSLGQIVFVSKQLNHIDITELKSGLYFIKAINNSGLTETIALHKI